MTTTLFVSILLGGALLTALLTQAIKQWYYNKNQSAPPNLIAAVNAIVVGGLVTSIIYIWMDIPWTIKNILAIVVMILFVWIGSMIGYKSIFESIQQYKVWQEQIKNGKIPDDLVETIDNKEDFNKKE